MKFIPVIGVLFVGLSVGYVEAGESFDYSNIQTLYVIQDDNGYSYGKFPTFLKYRDLISEKMNVAQEEDVELSSAIYEIRTIGIREETTLYIGDAWIGDGTRFAQLTEDELRWVHWAYEIRKNNNGFDHETVEMFVRSELERQKDPAWQPMP